VETVAADFSEMLIPIYLSIQHHNKQDFTSGSVGISFITIGEGHETE
jgi:hypothetical protein